MTTPIPLVESCVQLERLRKRWNREEYKQLCEARPMPHLELVEGELIDKMGKNWPHISALTLLHGWLIGVFGLRMVHQEASIDVSPEDNPTSQPEPDLIATKDDLASYVDKGRPAPQDLLLVIEVADSSLHLDLVDKAGLYARAGIADYWVLVIPSRRMIVHRDPRNGAYGSVASFGAEEQIAPLAAPDAFLRIGDVFVGGRG